MATDLARKLVLGVCVVILAFVGYRALTIFVGDSGTSGAPRGASNPATGRNATGGAQAVTAPDVHIRALEEDRPRPEETERNLFRFKTKPAPPPVAPPSRGVVVAPPAAPSGPAPPPPIPLKFFGVIEVTHQGRRIAGLVDQYGHTYGGGEGDIVAGQYKILRIGAESIEMSYIDGRGRQTIRLSGS